MTLAIYDVAALRLGESGAEDCYWPLARSEVLAVRDRLLADLVPFLRRESVSNPHARILSLLIYVLGEVLATYQAQALIRRARLDGRAPVFSPHAKLANALLNERLPELFPTVSLLHRGISGEPMWKPYARTLRSAIRRDVVRGAVMAGVDLRRDTVTIATGEMISQHATAVGPVHHLPLGNWFAPLTGAARGFAGTVPPAFVDTILDLVRAAFAAGNEPLVDGSAAYLRAWVTDAMNLADRHLGVLLSAPERIPRRLWRGTGGLIWARLLSFACRELGGEVTGHDHSHGQGAWTSYSDTIIELPFCDRFMVWTTTQRDMALRNLRPDLCLPGEPPQILAVPGMFKPKITVQAERKAPPSRTWKPVAMYVGTLYVDDFVPFTPLHPAPVLVDWELRLFGKLREWGYEVLLKPHPESRNRLPQTCLDALGVRVVNERFEEVYAQADILLFGQTNSSTFFGALGTDSPIVLANEPLNPWQPEARALAAQRCGFAETSPGVDNRLETDWLGLRVALDAARGLRNRDFYRQYFLQ